MKLSRLKFSSFARTAILVLLMAAQGIANAHELDHLSNGDYSLCATCSLGNGLSAAVAVNHDALIVFEQHTLAPAHSFQQVFTSHFAIHLPRAPPVSR